MLQSLFSKKWIPAPLAERTDSLGNPERGLYTIVRFDAATGRTPKEEQTVDVLVLPEEQTLILVEINLHEFAACALSDQALQRIDGIFHTLEQRGFDLIVRFLYDWNGRGLESEPQQVGQILAHIRQLSPLLQAHAPHIFTTQGLFTGSWGEMHHTRYSSAFYMKQLFDELRAATGEHSFLAVRCPNLWRGIFRSFHPNADPAARDGRERLGLFNDAICASETDMGTYGEIMQMHAMRWNEKFARDDELQFQTKLCTRVPNGGEVVHPGPYNDLTEAVKTLRRMRLTYLNSDYDTAVLEKWKQTPYPHAEGVWSRMSGYDYIAAHLGYRYMLHRCRLSGDPSSRQLSLTLENTGFAPCYHSVEAALHLQNGQQLRELPISADLRNWLPGEKQTLIVSLPPLLQGRWQVSLSLKLSGKEISLANTASGNRLGELCL